MYSSAAAWDKTTSRSAMLQLGVVDGSIGDDDVAATVAAAGLGAVRLGLHHVAVITRAGHRQDDAHEDHTLTATSSEPDLYQFARPPEAPSARGRVRARRPGGRCRTHGGLPARRRGTGSFAALAGKPDSVGRLGVFGREARPRAPTACGLGASREAAVTAGSGPAPRSLQPPAAASRSSGQAAGDRLARGRGDAPGRPLRPGRRLLGASQIAAYAYWNSGASGSSWRTRSRSCLRALPPAICAARVIDTERAFASSSMAAAPAGGFRLPYSVGQGTTASMKENP